ncbi:hypothetical protein Glove_384g20 [Diversispora epigaea]|uniref:Protein kinase domain-containing protein n=1 Tax=Diversispora epigaea TaxID=1348612 RepID=A0A397HBF7_9GLOM|nr:hypothetical protein Glove_384g20 [Diversispora epigaea]
MFQFNLIAYNNPLINYKLFNQNYITGSENLCGSFDSKQFQDESVKCEDDEIDKFIRQEQLKAKEHQNFIEWIPFNKLKNLTDLAKGGFGTVYKAKWEDGPISWDNEKKNWNRLAEQDVCLKTFYNANKDEFLQEIKNQLKSRSKNTIAIYGITKNSKNEYMIVMNYAEYGSLRELLNNKFERLTWEKKSLILSDIVNRLKNIHKMGKDVIHKDFHSGNIVNQTFTECYITDLGLCKPVTENDPKKIYGVIPYMAPETLRGEKYTQASDIYSFGMVMLEVLTSYPPYYDTPHNEDLAMKIREGDKPEIKCEIPKFFKEIMEKCWNLDPRKRPTAEELKSQLDKYSYGGEIRKQVKAANKSNTNFIQYDPNEKHPEAKYTSEYLSFVKFKN